MNAPRSDDSPDGSAAGEPNTVAGDALAECTAILATVPYDVAKRLEIFLNAHQVPCRVRRSDAAPETLADQAMRSTAPTADEAPRRPIGRVIRTKLKRDLSAEIAMRATGMRSAYDVLVRPEDVPSELASAGAAGPATHVERAASGATPSSVATAAGDAVRVAELPWNAAWELVASLEAAGIRAAVLEPNPSTAHLPMERRMVPVAVRSQDADRARALIEG